MARTKQTPRKSTQSTASNVEPQKIAAKQPPPKKSPATPAAVEKSPVERTPSQVTTPNIMTAEKQVASAYSNMAMPPSTPPPSYSTQSELLRKERLNKKSTTTAGQQSASDSSTIAVTQQQQPSASAAVKRKVDTDLSASENGTVLMQEQEPPSKKFRIDFTSNVNIVVGGNTFTVPKNLIQARSTYLARKIKELGDPIPSTAHIALPAAWNVSCETFGTYLQLLFTGQILLSSAAVVSGFIQKDIVLLQFLVEDLEDSASINLVSSVTLQQLRSRKNLIAVTFVRGIYQYTSKTASAFRSMLVDHTAELGVTSLPKGYPVEFLEDLSNELLKRQKSLPKTVFDESVPVEEAVKEYAMSF